MDFREAKKMVFLKNNNDEAFYEFVLSRLGSIQGEYVDVLVNCLDLSQIDNKRGFFEKVYPHCLKLSSYLCFNSKVRLVALGELLGENGAH